jgi:hypothetical protein
LQSALDFDKPTSIYNTFSHIFCQIVALMLLQRSEGTIFVVTLLGMEPALEALLHCAPSRGDAMSRWMQRRRGYERKRNAFLLLTLSGAVRSADVEIPYSRERRVCEAEQFRQQPCSKDGAIHMVNGYQRACL